jgi:HEPN domain-containing protein
MLLINTGKLYMDKKKIINELVEKWIQIAEKDLLTAKQLSEASKIVTDNVCFHCQQAVEKYLKAFLVKHQIEVTKTHNIMTLINLCATIDRSFKKELEEADILTDYAVEIRYPDDWYEPTLEESKKAYAITLKVRKFIINKLR